MKILADVGDAGTGDIAAEEHASNPDGSTHDVVGKVSRIAHHGGAGDGRAEGADDRNETREDYGAPAIFFVKIVRALQVTPTEKKGVLTTIQGRTGFAANPVAELITGDGADDADKNQAANGKEALASEDTRGDEKGIAGKKKANEESRFHENDEPDERGPAPADQFSEAVRMIERLKEVKDRLEQAVWCLAEKGIGARRLGRSAAKIPQTIR